MEGLIAGRSVSEVPGLDLAEMRSWQYFLEAALRMSAMLNRGLVESHRLTLVDVRLLDLLNKSPGGAARMGDLADGLMSLPSRVTRQIRRLEVQGLVSREASPDDGRGVVATITDEGRMAVRPGHDHLRHVRESALPGPAVAPTGGGAGGELPADQRRAEGGGRATDAARPASNAQLRQPLPLSAVAWQSGLMHSP